MFGVKPLPMRKETFLAMIPLLVGCAVAFAQVDNVTAKAVESLVKDLSDKEDEVRVKALQALAGYRADAQPALPAISKVLKDGTDDVRREAARALSVLATHATDAIPALV